MNDLTVFQENGKPLTDSREVAQMIGKPHYDLIKSIRQYCDYLTEGNFPVSEFFIESTYHDPTGRELPCYHCTRRGCDMIANKLSGRKGVLFTARYTTQFEKMENYIKAGKASGIQFPLQEVVESIEVVARSLRVNEAGRVKMYHDFYKDVGIPTGFLPVYVPGRVQFSATTLLRKIGAPVSAVVFNRLMLAQGYLEQKTRPSSKGNSKKFWCLTEAGQRYGENQVNPNNPRETQPTYYEDTFEELYGVLTADNQALSIS